MKKLFLIRHAKSSWDYQDLSDFERPLNKRGKRDAPFMAKLLARQGFTPDLMISSPANRAITTARYFSESLDYSFDKILIEPKLYEASSPEIEEVVKDLEDSFHKVMLFAHNPGLTDFANKLTGNSIDNIPTCGIVSVNIKADSWQEISSLNSDMLFFEYPRKYFS